MTLTCNLAIAHMAITIITLIFNNERPCYVLYTHTGL